MFKISKIIHYYEFYLCTLFVYTNGSWLFFEVDKIILFGLQLVSILFYIYLKFLNGERVKKPNFLALFFIFMPFLSKIINLNINSSFINTFSSAAVYISLSFLSKENLFNLLDKFARIIFFLCIVTLIISPITLINYSILNIFPIHYSPFDSDGYGYFNLLVYTERVSNDFRTQSIFWEPGAWAFNLMFAFYWLAVKRKEYKKIPYFIVGVLLATSTTGLVLLMLILLYLIFQREDVGIKKKMIIYLGLSIFVVIAVLFYLGSNTNINVGALLYNQTIGKITGSSEASALSFSDRSESTQRAFNIAFDNPFFGVGKLGADDSLFVTSSLSEIAYQLGLIYLLAYVFVFRRLFNNLGFILSFIFVIFLLNGEAISYYILCSLILIYGTKTFRKNGARHFIHDKLAEQY